VTADGDVRLLGDNGGDVASSGFKSHGSEPSLAAIRPWKSASSTQVSAVTPALATSSWVCPATGRLAQDHGGRALRFVQRRLVEAQALTKLTSSDIGGHH
jgi:hypothetical protein